MVWSQKANVPIVESYTKAIGDGKIIHNRFIRNLPFLAMDSSQDAVTTSRKSRKRWAAVAAAVLIVSFLIVLSGVTPLYHRGFVGMGGIIVEIPVTIVYQGNASGYLHYEGHGNYSFQALSNGSISNFTLLFISSLNSSHWITKIYTNSSGVRVTSISPNPPFSFTSRFAVTVISYSSSQNMWRSIPTVVLLTT